VGRGWGKDCLGCIFFPEVADAILVKVFDSMGLVGESEEGEEDEQKCYRYGEFEMGGASFIEWLVMGPRWLNGGAEK
jgi:hypothetical protein